MKRQNRKFFLSLWLLASLFWQATHLQAQQRDEPGAIVQESSSQDPGQIIKILLRQSRGAEFPALLEKLFGDEAGSAAAAFDEDAEQLLLAVNRAGAQKAEDRLQREIKERKEKPGAKQPVGAPTVKTTSPAAKPKPKARPAGKSRKIGFNRQPQLNWRQLAFGFQPLPTQDIVPEIKITETDKEIISSGEAKKSFETKEARGTRTQKAETRYIKDGATFGVEIKNTQIIEAVSKRTVKASARKQ